MTTKAEKKEYVFDADGKNLGRLATEIATVLRGKNSPSFQPHLAANVHVIVNNASKIDLPANKAKKEYSRYSGYPGGLKFEKRSHMIERKGYKDVFEKAVFGMLPNNKLRKVMMKNLTINE